MASVTVEVSAAEAAGVGRRVDAALAADRKLIRLVGARRALYARSDLPVASYHAQVRRLWQDVANQMGWSVPEVRRKWSHLRNSYSRHLRNAVAGARTNRGRAVSRWHLADDLAFLRDHMATDTRAAVYAPTMLALQMGNISGSSEADTEAEATAETDAWAGVRAGSWGGGSDAGRAAEAWAGGSDADDGSFSEEEGSSYFQFFRGLHEEYRLLAPRRRRAWRRACLQLLHAELDAADAAHAELDTADADADAHEQLDVKPLIVERPVP